MKGPTVRRRSLLDVRDEDLDALKQETLARRYEIIQALAEERGSRVITLMHRRDLWEDPGQEESLTIEDSESILMEIRETPKDRPIDLILHTPGGALKMEVIYCELCDPKRYERVLELDAQGLIKRPKRPIY